MSFLNEKDIWQPAFGFCCACVDKYNDTPLDDVLLVGDEAPDALPGMVEGAEPVVQPAKSLCTPLHAALSCYNTSSLCSVTTTAESTLAVREVLARGTSQRRTALSRDIPGNELTSVPDVDLKPTMNRTGSLHTPSQTPGTPGARIIDVVLQMEFEEYDPTKRLTVTRDIHGDVIRARHRKFKRLVSDGTSSDSVCSVKSGSVKSGKSECAKTSGTSSTFSQTSQLPFEQDAITNWGVLIGKALWCRMKGQGQRSHRRKLGLLAVAFHGSTYLNRISMTKEPRTPGRGAGRGAVRRAMTVVSQLQEMIKRVGREETDIFDADWHEDALNFLFSADYLDTLMILASGARQCFQNEPMVVQVSQPCKVFGDTHGQLRDLLLLFHAFGCPGTRQSFVFNGDFVDRGAHQLEVVGILFALKLAFPSYIWLVRGNHEDTFMNRKYGFESECLKAFGENGRKAFDLFQKAFQWLPMACLIDDQILTVHGGIGDGRWTIAELSCVGRPLTSEQLHRPESRWLYNILWSDPIPDDDNTEETAMVFGVHSSPRNASAVQFGWNVTKTFCALNGIGLVVRSHQVTAEGRGFEIMHDEKLVRVFSARDYEAHCNDAAVLQIERGQDCDSKTPLLVRPQVLVSLTKGGRDADAMVR